MTTITLSPKQTQAFEKIMEWFRDEETPKKEFVLAGYAGAGKTSLAKVIKKEIGAGAVFCAYTGKAVNVLRSKQCTPVSTIHSAIYTLVDHDKKRLEELKEKLKDALGFEEQSIRHEISRLEKEHYKPKFEFSGSSDLKKAKLIIVDEYSMLDHKVVGDLRLMGKKILFMGDPFQLPPVNGVCPLEGKEDFFLDEIHRQALDSGIVRASIDIREGRILKFSQGGDFDFIQGHEVYGDLYLQADQMIVGRNATRSEMNRQYRAAYGRDHYLPVAGDKMICLKNDHKVGLFNGMIGYATEDSEKQSDLDIWYALNFTAPDESKNFTHLRAWEGDILGQDKDYNGSNIMMRSLQRFTYAYAITCHKSQGSEFGNVVVINEPIGDTDLLRARWLYTAITRGKQKVTLVQL